jgi:hypothetical protein
MAVPYEPGSFDVPDVGRIIRSRPPEPNKSTNRYKPSPSTVNDTTDDQNDIREQTVLGANSVIPHTYGLDRHHPEALWAGTKNGNLYVLYIVGKGPIGGYKNYWVDGLDVYDSGDGFVQAKGGTLQVFTGNNAVVSSLLSEAFGAGFTETYNGYAYIVLKAPPDSTSGFPRLEVEVEGLLVPRYDWCSAFERTTGSAGDRNLIRNSVDPNVWSFENGATATTLDNLGMFHPIELATAGNIDARAYGDALSGITIAAVTVYWQYGTSNDCRITVENQITSQEAHIDFDSSGNYTVTANGSLGTLLVLDTYLIGTEYYVTKFYFVPLTAQINSLHRYHISPRSSTSGENIIVYGMQVEESLGVYLGTAEYTANPVNISCSLMTQKANWNLDFASAAEAAMWNNDVIAGQWHPRRELGMSFVKPKKLTSVLETMRAYTGCFYTWKGGYLYHVRYKSRADQTPHVLNADNIEQLTPSKKKQKDIPTVAKIQYTDANDDYKKREVVVKALGVDTGDKPRRVARVNLTGYHRYNQAKREGIERINTGLADLSMKVLTYDNALEYEIGDRVVVDYPVGDGQGTLLFQGKEMWVNGIKQTKEAGIWEVSLDEYQEELFSDEVEAEPSWPDTELPVHQQPDPPTNLVLNEGIYKRRDGSWDNRIEASWVPSTSGYVVWYLVKFKVGADLIGSVTVANLTTYTIPGEQPPVDRVFTTFGPVTENTQYTVEVQAVTTLYVSNPLSGTITPDGKEIIPSDVTGFTGYEIGGEVRLSWDAAIDLDITHYQIQYGPPGFTWWDGIGAPGSAVVLDQIDALRYKTKEVPAKDAPGWDFLIKAIDSVGQQSVNAARISNLVVTLDDKAYLVDTGAYPDAVVEGTLAHVTTEARGGTEVVYTNTSSQTWSSLFSGGTLNSKTDPLAQYQATPGTNFSWESDEYDLTLDVGGTFRQTSNFTTYKGSVTEEMGLRNSATGFLTWFSVLSQNGTFRYGAMRVTGLGVVRIDTSLQQYQVDAVTKSENGYDQTDGTGKATITMNSSFTVAKLITITPEGSTGGIIPIIDNVLTSGNNFDVYLFDVNDVAQTNSWFYWTFEGV